jgi:hypothetical protein
LSDWICEIKAKRKEKGGKEREKDRERKWRKVKEGNKKGRERKK